MLDIFTRSETTFIPAMSLERLRDRAVLVTGGSGAYGRAICVLFAREGASVAVHGRNVERLQKTFNLLESNHGNKHCIIEGDITCADQVKKLFVEAEKKLGKKVTILVNNAGILKSDFLDDITEEAFDDIINVNLKGAFLVAKEFLTSLRDIKETGTIGWLINISSIGGIRGGQTFAHYNSSKFGMIGMTKSVALEYSKHRVRCNAVLPGCMDTPMTSFMSGSMDEIRKLTPMGRLGKPDEVASVCLFLASEESSYVNGACVEVGGGFGI